MANIQDFLDTLLEEGTEFARQELEDLIQEATDDSKLFIKHMGELATEFLKMRASGELTNDEFRELMEDLVDLEKMQFHKLSAEAKIRAQKIANGLCPFGKPA